MISLFKFYLSLIRFVCYSVVVSLNWFNELRNDGERREDEDEIVKS